MNSGSTDMRRTGDALMASVRDNPIGAALLGMGLVWMVASRAGTTRALGRALDSTGEALSSGASAAGQAARRAGAAAGDAIGETMNAATRQVREAADGLAATGPQDAFDRANEVVDRAAAYVHNLSGKLRETGSDDSALGQFRAARARLAQALEDQPLLLAAGALAVGAAIAATLPVAESEKRGIRDTARDVVAGARELVQDGVVQAVDRIDDAARAVVEEANRRGLTPDQLKQQASAVAEKAREAASQAAEAISAQPRSSHLL